MKRLACSLSISGLSSSRLTRDYEHFLSSTRQSHIHGCPMVMIDYLYACKIILYITQATTIYLVLDIARVAI